MIDSTTMHRRMARLAFAGGFGDARGARVYRFGRRPRPCPCQPARAAACVLGSRDQPHHRTRHIAVESII